MPDASVLPAPYTQCLTVPEPEALPMSKLNQWLTLVANLSVVAGIVFLAAEMRQNTRSIQAQTRDAISEKQMDFYGWVATNRDLATVYDLGLRDELDDPVDRRMFIMFLQGVFREWENSHYQFSQGLFTAEDFQARVNRWSALLGTEFARSFWDRNRESFAPSFRAEIDRIVAEVEQAQ
jgi:hypothetical protein